VENFDSETLICRSCDAASQILLTQQAGPHEAHGISLGAHLAFCERLHCTAVVNVWKVVTFFAGLKARRRTVPEFSPRLLSKMAMPDYEPAESSLLALSTVIVNYIPDELTEGALAHLFSR
jgi:hypothetical protein